MTDRRKGYSEQNKQAWDSLYGRFDAEIWGREPIPFVDEFINGASKALKESSKLLDAAAGEGRHVPVLLGLPGEVFATDASSNALKKMSRIDGSFECVQCDLERMPFDDGFFDFALLIDTVETLPNIEEALAELFRILKPGGRLLCNIPGREDGIAGEDMEDAAEPEDASYLYQGRYYYRFYEESEAVDLVRSAGFEIVRNEIREWTEPAHPGFRDYRHSHTSRVLMLVKPGGKRNCP